MTADCQKYFHEITTRNLLPPVKIPASYNATLALARHLPTKPLTVTTLTACRAVAKSNLAAFQDFAEIAKRIYREAKDAQPELASERAYFDDFSCTLSLSCTADANRQRRNEAMFGTVADLPAIVGVTRRKTLDEHIVDLFVDDFFRHPTGKPGKAHNNGAFGRRN
jgi:hypothetical protein